MRCVVHTYSANGNKLFSERSRFLQKRQHFYAQPKRTLQCYCESLNILTYILRYKHLNDEKTDMILVYVPIVYFFLVGGCARHLQNPATKCDVPIGYSIPLTNREVAFRCLLGKNIL
jgi:hypothetical protein